MLEYFARPHLLVPYKSLVTKKWLLHAIKFKIITSISDTVVATLWIQFISDIGRNRPTYV